MAENKTRATDARVDDYLAAIENDERRKDCETLSRLMSQVTKQPPVMWGTGIVGFGSYHYKYDSGREGDCCLTGFAARKGDISVYLTASIEERDALLATLGRHKMGKGCLYLRKLGDIDLKVLEQLVAGSVAAIRARYP
jgi:hypothetical protein